MKPLVLVPLLGTLWLAGAARAEDTGYQAVSLSAPSGGKPIESKVVADTPYVKSVVIVVRKGATLAEHSSPHAAAIQAISGKGRVRVGSKLEDVSTSQMLLLAPGIKHEVIADKRTDLVLLVHHMKGAPAANPGAPPPSHVH